MTAHDEFEEDLGPPPGAEDDHDPITNPDENETAMWLHLSQLAGLVVPLAGLIVPIVIWQIKKDEMPSIDRHGKVVVNWIISSIIYMGISILLVLIIIGIFTLIAVAILTIVFPIIGGLKAKEGIVWRYPLSIQFLK